MCSKIKDITSQRFGRLVAVRPSEKRTGTSIVWDCICDCGNIAFVLSHNLTSGKATSCGYTEEQALL